MDWNGIDVFCSCDPFTFKTIYDAICFMVYLFSNNMTSAFSTMILETFTFIKTVWAFTRIMGTVLVLLIPLQCLVLKIYLIWLQWKPQRGTNKVAYLDLFWRLELYTWVFNTKIGQLCFEDLKICGVERIVFLTEAS